VPGRKSDVQGCQWLQYLHSVGLLNASFRPPAAICAVRSLMRHRESGMRAGCQHLLRVQKGLDQMNVQLHHAVTDITGETGLAILDAIVAGEGDPEALVRLRHCRCKKSMAAQSLHRSKAELGDWSRRLKAKLGTKAAVTAAAHKLARILWAMVRHHKSILISVLLGASKLATAEEGVDDSLIPNFAIGGSYLSLRVTRVAACRTYPVGLRCSGGMPVMLS